MTDLQMLTGLSDGCDEQTQEEADKASDDNLDSVAPTSEVKQQPTSDVTQGPSSASTSEHVSLADNWYKEWLKVLVC